MKGVVSPSTSKAGIDDVMSEFGTDKLIAGTIQAVQSSAAEPVLSLQ